MNRIRYICVPVMIGVLCTSSSAIAAESTGSLHISGTLNIITEYAPEKAFPVDLKVDFTAGLNEAEDALRVKEEFRYSFGSASDTSDMELLLAKSEKDSVAYQKHTAENGKEIWEEIPYPISEEIPLTELCTLSPNLFHSEENQTLSGEELISLFFEDDSEGAKWLQSIFKDLTFQVTYENPSEEKKSCTIALSELTEQDYANLNQALSDQKELFSSFTDGMELQIKQVSGFSLNLQVAEKKEVKIDLPKTEQDNEMETEIKSD